MHESTVTVSSPLRLSRREAWRRILTASALAGTLDINVYGAAAMRGVRLNSDFLQNEIPWPRVLLEYEKQIISLMADVIIPATDHGPAASAVGVTDFIDEWVSAPFEKQKRDRDILRSGLTWIEGAAQKLFEKPFTECDGAQLALIVEGRELERMPEYGGALLFLGFFRDMVGGAYYSTPEGWNAIGYTGNKPVAQFPAWLH